MDEHFWGISMMNYFVLSMQKKKRNSIGILSCILMLVILFQYLYSVDVFAVNNTPGNPIKNVPMIYQNPTLPTGCEIVSAAMLLQWAGVKVSPKEIADAIPKGSLPYQSGSKLIGGNPDYEFVGDPYKKSGFGVFHKPIADCMNKYKVARDLTGCSFDELLKVIDSNHPVVVWATINMKKPSINSVWYDTKGNKVVWKTPQHAMVLIGYTQSKIIVNDPLKGDHVQYSRSDFEKYWVYMGSQAVTVK